MGRWIVCGSLFLLAQGGARAQSVVSPAVFERLSPPSSAVAGQPVATQDASQAYSSSMSRFAEYLSGKRPVVKNDANLPFLLSHGAPAARSVLLVHGLTDSPYYMRTLADVFYGAGYNVVAILLPGHGTRPEDLLKVRLAQWKQEVQFGLDIAGGLGGEVSLAGFSTGGALALDAVVRNYEKAQPQPLGDVFLFSPALQIANKEVAEVCRIPDIEHFKPWAEGAPDEPEDNPYRYKKMALNAVCQLYHLTVEDSRHGAALRSQFAAHGIGVFSVESLADTTVRPEAVVKFMSTLPDAVRKESILYAKDVGVAHAGVTRPETNPFYGDMEARIEAFVAPRGSADKLQGSVFRQPLRSGALEETRAFAQPRPSF